MFRCHLTTDACYHLPHHWRHLGFVFLSGTYAQRRRQPIHRFDWPALHAAILVSRIPSVPVRLQDIGRDQEGHAEEHRRRNTVGELFVYIWGIPSRFALIICMFIDKIMHY